MTLNIAVKVCEFQKQNPSGRNQVREVVVAQIKGGSLLELPASTGSKPHRIVGWTQTALLLVRCEPRIPRMPKKGELYFMCQLAPRDCLIHRGMDSDGITKSCLEQIPRRPPKGDALAKCQLAPGQA